MTAFGRLTGSWMKERWSFRGLGSCSPWSEEPRVLEHRAVNPRLRVNRPEIVSNLRVLPL